MIWCDKDLKLKTHNLKQSWSKINVCMLWLWKLHFFSQYHVFIFHLTFNHRSVSSMPFWWNVGTDVKLYEHPVSNIKYIEQYSNKSVSFRIILCTFNSLQYFKQKHKLDEGFTLLFYHGYFKAQFNLFNSQIRLNVNTVKVKLAQLPIIWGGGGTKFQK